MKKREGFVSNSSSSAFILDLRKDGAETIEKINKHVPRPYPGDMGRGTVFCTRSEVIQFANSYIHSYHQELEEDCQCLGHWVREWISKLGAENIGFARESDEGMGGYLRTSVDGIAVAEMEYH